MQLYWIEEIPYDCAHGNPWWVYTKYFDIKVQREITCTIPYHSNAYAYEERGDEENPDPGYDDLFEYEEAWGNWLSFTTEQRQEYVRTFRKNKNCSDMNEMNRSNNKLEVKKTKVTDCVGRTPSDIRQYVQMQLIAAQAFGTFSCGQVGTQNVTATEIKEKETSMNNDAIYHLERDLNKAHNLADKHLGDKYHLQPHRAETVREYLDMIKAGEIEALDDKTLDRKLNDWELPNEWITLRKVPADQAGYTAEKEKLDEAYRAAHLAVKTTQDPDKTREKVTEPFRSKWVH